MGLFVHLEAVVGTGPEEEQSTPWRQLSQKRTFKFLQATEAELPQVSASSGKESWEEFRV